MGKSEKMLMEYIRKPTKEDLENLPQFSYSRIEQYKNCPMAYKLKYVDGKSLPSDTSLALELGSLCHYVLETKGKMMKTLPAVNYDVLRTMLYNGVKGANSDSGKPTEEFLGVNDLKRKYFEEWGIRDSSSDMNYDDKIDLFLRKVLREEMMNDSWKPTLFEHGFSFVWDNRVILHGYIDRIDTWSGYYRTIDYKTSKKVYESDKLATSLQFGIYALAILNEFGKLPIESKYRFILIDQTQNALTVGWEKRIIKALTKVFDSIEQNGKNDEFEPNPSPLCHWCNYCKHNPNATKYKNECQYYSLWTPEKKTFEVNREWSKNDPLKDRKIIF